MKERLVDRERTVVPHDQAAEVAQPGNRAFDRPAPLVPPERSSALRRRLAAVAPVGAINSMPRRRSRSRNASLS